MGGTPGTRGAPPGTQGRPLGHRGRPPACPPLVPLRWVTLLIARYRPTRFSYLSYCFRLPSSPCLVSRGTLPVQFVSSFLLRSACSRTPTSSSVTPLLLQDHRRSPALAGRKLHFKLLLLRSLLPVHLHASFFRIPSSIFSFREVRSMRSGKLHPPGHLAFSGASRKHLVPFPTPFAYARARPSAKSHDRHIFWIPCSRAF